MLNIVIYSILAGILLMLIILSYYFQSLIDDKKDIEDDSKTEVFKKKIDSAKGYVYTCIILAIIIILIITYLVIKGTPWENHMMEWLNIIIRVMHITFGIAWIGASFYFVFLENALNRTKDVRDELAGNLWAVHGGGFYYVEKYKNAPQKIPKELHWFKYESYFTWLSGFSLLFVVY